MKKMILALAVMISTSTAFAFAGEEKVAQKVLSAFKSEFASAQQVEWTDSGSFYKASFSLSGQRVFAFYTTDGELMGLTRYISSIQLPISLQSSLKKGYSDFWITDLFEVANAEGTSYYITLEDADNKIVLKASSDGEWTNYQKSKKA